MGQFKAMQCGNLIDATCRPGSQLWKQCKWRHLVAKYATNASGAIWWPNCQLIQMASSGGQLYNFCKWRHLVAKFATSENEAIWWPNLKSCHVVAEFSPSHGVNFWVRCASSNVFKKALFCVLHRFNCRKIRSDLMGCLFQQIVGAA